MMWTFVPVLVAAWQIARYRLLKVGTRSTTATLLENSATTVARSVLFVVIPASDARLSVVPSAPSGWFTHRTCWGSVSSIHQESRSNSSLVANALNVPMIVVPAAARVSVNRLTTWHGTPVAPCPPIVVVPVTPLVPDHVTSAPLARTTSWPEVHVADELNVNVPAPVPCPAVTVRVAPLTMMSKLPDCGKLSRAATGNEVLVALFVVVVHAFGVPIMHTATITASALSPSSVVGSVIVNRS